MTVQLQKATQYRWAICPKDYYSWL